MPNMFLLSCFKVLLQEIASSLQGPHECWLAGPCASHSVLYQIRHSISESPHATTSTWGGGSRLLFMWVHIVCYLRESRMVPSGTKLGLITACPTSNY